MAAAIPTPLSPRETCKGTEAMGPHQAFIPHLLRCTSYPSRSSAAPQWAASAKPSALLERRAKLNPSLKVSAFQAGVGTSATRNSAFQAGVGTSATSRNEGTSAGASAFQAATGTSSNSSPAATTLYDVLELPRTATETEIKTAYRRLARLHHPDRAPLQEKEASTTKFLQIHSAYAALSDPHTRAQYDLQLSPSYQSAGYHNRPTSSNYYSPRTPSSSNYCSPRTPFSSGRGRSWETDQCWC